MRAEVKESRISCEIYFPKFSISYFGQSILNENKFINFFSLEMPHMAGELINNNQSNKYIYLKSVAIGWENFVKAEIIDLNCGGSLISERFVSIILAKGSKSLKRNTIDLLFYKKYIR